MTALPRVRRQSLSADAAETLRTAILDGTFAPGAQLGEVSLAESLGVSRGSVREAIAQLAHERLVVTGWHRPTTVAEVTPAGVAEVYELRQALDALAATTAARRAHEDPAVFDALDTAVDRMAELAAADAAPMELLQADIAFHDAVYDAAANGRLSEAWQAIRSQVLHFQGVRVRLSAAGGYGAMLADEHRELVRVFRTGRPAAIAKAASAHAASAREALVAALGF